jgi:hypothetical protein
MEVVEAISGHNGIEVLLEVQRDGVAVLGGMHAKHQEFSERLLKFSNLVVLIKGIVNY